jgi:predicted RND superfamily exporter protein
MKSTNAIKDTFGISEVVYLITDNSEPRSKEEDLETAMKTIPNIKSTQCIESLADSKIPDTFLPDKLKNQFQEGKYRYMMINLTTKAAEDSTNKTIDMIKARASQTYGSNYYLSGEAVLTKDLINLTDKDIKTVDIISIAAVFVILMLAMKSVTLPVILVAVIELAIFFNLGIPYYTGTQVPFIASMTIGAIQLGSSINYSILMVTRYREELQFHDKVQAIKNAVVGTGPSIITSALTLAITTIGVGMVSKIKMIGQFATMIGRGTLISFVAVIFILPAVLLIFDSVIKYTTLGWRSLNRKSNIEVKGEESV